MANAPVMVRATCVPDAEIAQVRELVDVMQRGMVTPGVRLCGREIEHILAGWCAPTRSETAPERLTPSEIRSINQAAAHLDIGIALSAEERAALARKLFAIAGNPMPDDDPMPEFVAGTLEGHVVLPDAELMALRRAHACVTTLRAALQKAKDVGGPGTASSTDDLLRVIDAFVTGEMDAGAPITGPFYPQGVQ